MRQSSDEFKKGIPFGWRSVLSGRGPCRLKVSLPFFPKGICRARDAEPHGGAKKTPTTKGSSSHFHKRSSFSVRSTVTRGQTQFLFRTLSVPNALLSPICLRQAVTRPLPAKISITMHWSIDAPPSARRVMRWNRQAVVPLVFSCSNTECGAWHPFFMQRCHPLGHCAPLAASEHFPRLKLKHSLRPCSSCPRHPRFCSSLGRMFTCFFPFPFCLPFCVPLPYGATRGGT